MAKPPENISGQYDYGHRDAARTKSFKIKAYDFKSQSDMKVRPTGNYADNAMEDPSALNEDEDQQGMLDRLHDILHNAGVSQAEIKNGVRLTMKGMNKVAGQLGVSIDDVRVLLQSLRTQHKEDDIEQIEEAVIRYGYEADVLGTVSINDNQTGESVIVSGSEGASLLGRLEMVVKDSEAEQAILGEFFSENLAEAAEPASAAIEPGEVNFAAEIKNETGSFNFPWSLQGRSGTATAAYSGDGKGFKISVISIRDQDGEALDAEAMRAEIRKQAIAFIGQE